MEELMFHSMMSAFLQEHVKEARMMETVRKVVGMLMLTGKTFTELDRSKQGIGEIHKIQAALGLFPELPAKRKKSDDVAMKLRTCGNQAYKAKDTVVALALYSAAVCTAESKGEMALAYANRSAVTYHLQEYENSIKDIDLALSTGQYPEHLKPKLIERKGKCFLALSQFEKAVQEFKQVAIILLQSDINTDKVTSLKGFIELIAESQGKKDMPLKPADKPKLTHGASKNIQSASLAIDIKYSRKMGRHIVAQVDIAPGDILAIEKPYASVLFHEHRMLFCHHCKKRSHSSIPCPSCTEIVFCSVVCRDTAWESYHSIECDVCDIMTGIGCTDSYLLAVRTLVKATKLGETLPEFMDESLNDFYAPEKSEKKGFVEGKYLSDDHRSVHNLMTNMEQRSQSDLLEVAVLSSILVYILKEASSFFDQSDNYIPSTTVFKPVSALQWNHIVAANLLMRYLLISDPNGTVTVEHRAHKGMDNFNIKTIHIVKAIYPLYSLLNHSCDPNIGFCPYDGDTLFIYANRPIARGQQIFRSYATHYAADNLFIRQIRLKSQFFFTCKCPACLEDWPQRDNMPEYPQFVSPKAEHNHGAEIRKALVDVPKMMLGFRNGVTENDLRFLKRLLILIHKHVKQPWIEFLRLDIALWISFILQFNGAQNVD